MRPRFFKLALPHDAFMRLFDASDPVLILAGALADVNALVCYAMKANSSQAVIKTLADLCAGADSVPGCQSATVFRSASTVQRPALPPERACAVR
jgi:hypothetical protein